MMKLHEWKNVIQDGDTVIISLGGFRVSKLTLRRDGVHQLRYGVIRHNELIGKPYGSRITCPKGYVHILAATPELWTASLLHRTQIIYTPDISLIVFNLNLQPGFRVLEAGTGSGSLSHSILRAILPGGHLYTGDFHESRSKIAQAEFFQHGYEGVVTCFNRDVCADGFGDEVPMVDAAFLDLPCPWLAVHHAAAKLKPGGKLATFSPCIEQVQQTATKMRELGFSSVTVMECLQQRYAVKDLYIPDPSSDVVNVEEPVENASEDGDCKNQSDNDDESDSKNNGRGVNSGLGMTTCVIPLCPTVGHTGYLTFGTKF